MLMTWNLSDCHSTSFQFLPRGWNRGRAPTTHRALTWYTELMEKICKTRNQVRFHKSISLSISCLDLSCTANLRKLYPPLSRHGAHWGPGSAERSIWQLSNREKLFDKELGGIRDIDKPSNLHFSLFWVASFKGYKGFTAKFGLSPIFWQLWSTLDATLSDWNWLDCTTDVMTISW